MARYQTLEPGTWAEMTFQLGGGPGAPKLGKEALGVYLRTLRERRGATLRELEAATGVSKAYLSQIEIGARASPPGIKVLRSLAQHYQIELDTLLFVAGLREADGLEAGGREEALRDQFRRLVTHPDIGRLVREENMRWFSPATMELVLTLAERLDRHFVRHPARSVAQLLAEGEGEEPSAEASWDAAKRVRAIRAALDLGDREGS